LKLSEEATRKAAERLRERYRELIIQEIRETCDPAQVEEENPMAFECVFQIDANNPIEKQK